MAEKTGDVLGQVNIHRRVWKDTGHVTVDFTKDAVGAQYSKEDLKKVGKGDLKEGIEKVKETFKTTELRPGAKRPLQDVLEQEETETK